MGRHFILFIMLICVFTYSNTEITYLVKNDLDVKEIGFSLLNSEKEDIYKIIKRKVKVYADNDIRLIDKNDIENAMKENAKIIVIDIKRYYYYYGAYSQEGGRIHLSVYIFNPSEKYEKVSRFITVRGKSEYFVGENVPFEKSLTNALSKAATLYKKDRDATIYTLALSLKDAVSKRKMNICESILFIKPLFENLENGYKPTFTERYNITNYMADNINKILKKNITIISDAEKAEINNCRQRILELELNQALGMVKIIEYDSQDLEKSINEFIVKELPGDDWNENICFIKDLNKAFKQLKNIMIKK